jgi:hypothetical protein
MEWIHETSHRDDCTAVRAVDRGDLWTPWSAAIRVELTAPDPARAGRSALGSFDEVALVSAWEVAPCADPRCSAERRWPYSPRDLAGRTRPRPVQRAVGAAAPRTIDGLSAGSLRYSSMVTATTR